MTHLPLIVRGPTQVFGVFVLGACCAFALIASVFLQWQSVSDGDLHAQGGAQDRMGKGGAKPIRAQMPMFRLEAVAVDAFENGPVAIRATCIYQGKDRLIVYKSSLPYDLGENIVPKWHGDLLDSGRPIYSVSGQVHGQETLKPGDTRTTTKFLHLDYTIIPPGKSQLKVTWPIYEPGQYGIGNLIARPNTTITVEVQRASPGNLAGLRKRWVWQIFLAHFAEDGQDRQLSWWTEEIVPCTGACHGSKAFA